MQLSTHSKRQILDITDDVAAQLAGNGIAAVFVQHTTAALTIMDLDPGTDQDLLDFFDSLVPDNQWRHPHDPSHTPDHLLASLVGPSIVVPVTEGRLQLGSWQRIVLLEFDGPRDRTITVTVMTT
ncbi:MAG TPA: secondary thiamine-phosphate synthase enzyme YjbQ [Candidatus Saccharimonadales bacterium]|nr:secondary thiamine-phosphate synthase enzyme YjbQ [Candidatus Saccharimonadales bacterium]